MVDINYGLGNYRGLGGSRRAEKGTGAGGGEKTAFARSMESIEAGKSDGAGVVRSADGAEGRKSSPEAEEAPESLSREAAAETKDRRDMSLAEYTWYIDRLISQMARRGYSRGNSVFVYISEEGYRAMQADPEYEAWVLKSIRDSYQFCRGMGGHDGYHSAHFFGASREEYRGQSWHSGCSKCEQERRRQQKLLRKKRLKALLKKRQEQRLLESKRLEKLRLDRLRLEKAVYKKLVVKERLNRKRLEEEYREEAIARREEASAFRIYQALARYHEQG